MAKTKVSEFDAVASNNTDINSVNVAEGCPPSGINNAIREMASLLKKQEVGTDAMTSPDINGGTIDGATIGGSSGVTIGVSDGTVSAPSIKFTSDTNTGIYRGGTDILKFVTAGTDAVTIDASQNTTFAGNLTIDKSSPTLFIEPTADTQTGYITFNNTAGSARGFMKYDYNTDTMSWRTGGVSNRMAIGSNGDISFYENTGSTPKMVWKASDERLGIGVSSPATTLHIGDSDTAVNGTMRFGQNATYYGFIQKVYATDKFDIGTNGSGQHISFTNNGSEAMRIDSSGNLLINTTLSATDVGIVLGNNGQTTMKRGTSGDVQFFVNSGSGTEVGKIQIGASSTSYITTSDHRLKENVTADWDATTRLKQLNPVRFNFTADADTTVDGFLAHEVQSVVPEAISGTHNEVDADGNPVYQGIDQSKLVPLLVKTIQELEARITALENGV